jgi:glutathione S-transferase
MTGKLARRPKELVEGRRATGAKALAILDRELTTRPFICGAQYTIADLSLYAYASRAAETNIPLQPYGYFRDWVARVEDQAGFVKQVHPYSIDPYSGNEL